MIGQFLSHCNIKIRLCKYIHPILLGLGAFWKENRVVVYVSSLRERARERERERERERDSRESLREQERMR